MKNIDNECFRWCHVRHLNPQKTYPQRIKKCDKKLVKNLNYTNVEFPVSQKQYNKIGKQNNININVFGYEKKQPYPIYVSKEKFKNRMNSLLITGGENEHCVLIKDFNKFMYNQTKHKNRKHFCMFCLQCFSSERVLIAHKDICININGEQAVRMPNKDNNTLKFNNFYKQLPGPFIIYADFEAITEKIQECKQNKSCTESYQKHKDCGYAYKVVCCYDDKHSKTVQTYRGENAVYKFIEKMLDEVKWCQNIKKKNFTKPITLTKENVEDFKTANKFSICNEKYSEKDIRSTL